jgi:hypothetical protein
MNEAQNRAAQIDREFYENAFANRVDRPAHRA